MFKNTLITAVFGWMICINPTQAENLTDSELARSMYEVGQISMQMKDWTDAIEAFNAAAEDQRLAAAAMYWQAYSHYQLKQSAPAKRLLEKMMADHPDSQWLDDAQVLLIEHGDGKKSASQQDTLDDELKLFTLQQVMFNNPEKALPKIKEMLEKSSSMQVKQNAIQLLGLSQSKVVDGYLFEYLKQNPEHVLKHQAIQMLSLRNSASSRKKLTQLYKLADDEGTKGAIIQGFIHHDGGEEILNMMQQEKNPKLKMHMIQMLGIKGESEALKTLYKGAPKDQKRGILEALGIAGEGRDLFEIIDQETDAEIRNQAIHSLVMVDEEGVSDFLIDLYNKSKNSSEKNTIIQMFIATNTEPQQLVDLVQSESSFDHKKRLLNSLMAMNGVTALKQVYSDSNDIEINKIIIRHLGVMGATDELMTMQSVDPKLANQPYFYQALGTSSGEIDEQFLMSQFQKGEDRVKRSILEVAMMRNNSAILIELLKAEKDSKVKKRIIEMLAMIDPDALIDAIEQQ